MNVLRFLIGILLLPVCVAVTRTLFFLVHSLNPDAGALSPSAWALIGGFLLWLLIYLTLPRPVRAYVLAHELTHALWGALMGAKVSRLRVGGQQGSVTLSKSNLFITLAPYFFPLYTVLVIVAYYVLAIFYNVRAWHLVWMALIGFSWSFHFTFTICSLMQHQSDVQQYGRLFSYTVIYSLNVLGIGLWVVLVSSASLEQLLLSLHSQLLGVYAAVWRAAERIPGQIGNKRAFQTF